MAPDGLRPPGGIGRANRLMGFLGVLGLHLIAARRIGKIFLPIGGADHLADGRDRFISNLHAVSAHIGDEADSLAVERDALVKSLCDPHRMGGREAELAACLLLQRGGREGRIGIAPGGPRLHGLYREGRRLQRLLEGFRFGAGANVEPLDLLAVGADQPGLERLGPRRRQRRDQRPVFTGDEFLDLQLAVADEPQCDRLHPAG